MHIKAITKTAPAPAATLEAMLDLVNQFISTLRGLEQLFGFDISQDIFGKES